jgi:hydroxymethylpyrimidine/phosphomethylpyrimidine kinase
MLASEETVKVVADAIQQHGILISVIDPVRSFTQSVPSLLTQTGDGIYQRP